MTDARIILLAMAAALFAVMLAVAAAQCIREMHAQAVKRRRAVRAPRPLYIEDLRHDRP